MQNRIKHGVHFGVFTTVLLTIVMIWGGGLYFMGENIGLWFIGLPLGLLFTGIMATIGYVVMSIITDWEIK